MNLDHLKLCVEPLHQTNGYQCARCNQVCCSACDRRLNPNAEIKTVVRYCPDWRCQREKRIEETSAVRAASKLSDEIRAFVRDKFVPGSLASLDELYNLATVKVYEALKWTDTKEDKKT